MSTLKIIKTNYNSSNMKFQDTSFYNIDMVFQFLVWNTLDCVKERSISSYLSICLSISISICLSIIHLSLICLSIHPSVYLKQGLALQPKLACNEQSSCLSQNNVYVPSIVSDSQQIPLSLYFLELGSSWPLNSQCSCLSLQVLVNYNT